MTKVNNKKSNENNNNFKKGTEIFKKAFVGTNKYGLYVAFKDENDEVKQFVSGYNALNCINNLLMCCTDFQLDFNVETSKANKEYQKIDLVNFEVS